MYDFAVILPCHLEETKYLERIYDFRKYGLLNIKNSKIKVFLLSGSGVVPSDLKSGWPCEIEFVNSNCFFDGPKTYNFMLNLNVEETKNIDGGLK